MFGSFPFLLTSGTVAVVLTGDMVVDGVGDVAPMTVAVNVVGDSAASCVEGDSVGSFSVSSLSLAPVSWTVSAAWLVLVGEGQIVRNFSLGLAVAILASVVSSAVKSSSIFL